MLKNYRRPTVVGEIIDAVADSDFNPDIVIDGLDECYQFGNIDGLNRGRLEGLGVWFIMTVSMLIALRYAEYKKKRKQKKDEAA